MTTDRLTDFDRDPQAAAPRHPPRVVLAWLAATAVVLAYSQTLALYGDEGFHLLAAQLVGNGEMPYRDFFYQHPPLFAYVYAGWMSLAGDTWRSAHALSALLTAGAFWLVLDQVVTGESGIRRAAGILGVVFMMTLSMQVLPYATVGHPYALSMLLGLAAYRFALSGRRTGAGGASLASGLAAGGAVMASFLSLPVVAVIAAWILVSHRDGGRWMHLRVFLLGAAAWMAPLGWFVAQAPSAVWFDLFEYQLFFRGPDYRTPSAESAIERLGVLYHWLRSSSGMPRTALAVVGVWLVARHGRGAIARHGDIVLAAGLAAGLLAFITAPDPTFPYYYVLTVPYLCILACHGLKEICGRHWAGVRPWVPATAIACVFLASLLRSAHGYAPQAMDTLAYWAGVEALAVEIDRVAPRNAPVYIADDEAVYFVSRRRPPPGVENQFGPEIEISAARRRELRLVHLSEIDAIMARGGFAAVWMDERDPRMKNAALFEAYRDRQRVSRARTGHPFWDPRPGFIFWSPVPGGGGPQRAPAG